MKHRGLLTIGGLLLAGGLVACGGASGDGGLSSTPVPSSEAGGTSSTPTPAKSTPAPKQEGDQKSTPASKTSEERESQAPANRQPSPSDIPPDDPALCNTNCPGTDDGTDGLSAEQLAFVDEARQFGFPRYKYSPHDVVAIGGSVCLMRGTDQMAEKEKELTTPAEREAWEGFKAAAFRHLCP